MSKHIEIERKFLVNFKNYISESLTFSETLTLSETLTKISTKSYRITQGYLVTDAKRTVRVRTKGDLGYLTIKGEANKNGFSRFEWEKEIPLNDALELLKLCEAGVIDKTRYEIIFEGKTFEVDVFYGENEGLVFAELELEREDEPFLKPDWLGEEVTGDIRYYNAYLSKHPYKS